MSRKTIPHFFLLVFTFILSTTEATLKLSHGTCTIIVNKLKLKGVYFNQLGNNRVFSLIHYSDKLIKEAEYAAKDVRIQKEMDELVRKELENTSPEVGTYRLSLGNGYFELKTKYGTRVIVRRVKNTLGGDDIYVVGKATKKGASNQAEVFNTLRDTFADFPAKDPHTTDPRQN